MFAALEPRERLVVKLPFSRPRPGEIFGLKWATFQRRSGYPAQRVYRVELIRPRPATHSASSACGRTPR